MLSRVVRLRLSVTLCAVLSTVVLSRAAVLYAEEGTCSPGGTGNVYRYSDGGLVGSDIWSLGPAAYPDYAPCLSDSQGRAIASCSNACRSRRRACSRDSPHAMSLAIIGS